MAERDRRYPDSPEKTVRDIRRATRRMFSTEEKVRIVLERLRSKETIAKLWWRIAAETGACPTSADRSLCGVLVSFDLLSHRSLLNGDDEPGILSYAKTSKCSTSADVGQLFDVSAYRTY